jgi:sensor domain CHASE-containing protein
MKPLHRNFALIILGLLAAGALGGSVVFAKKEAAAAHRLRSAAIAEAARASIQEALDEHLGGLADLSKAFESSPPAADDDYRELAVRTAVQGPAFAGVNYLNHLFVETFVYPLGTNRAVAGLDLKTRTDALPAAHRAVASHEPAATDLVALAQGGQGFLAYVPVRRENRWEGLVEGALDRDVFGRRYAAPAAPPRHDLSLMDESSVRPFYETAARQDDPFGGAYDSFFTLRFADRRWWGVLHPQFPPTVLGPLVGVMFLEMALAWAIARKILKKR